MNAADIAGALRKKIVSARFSQHDRLPPERTLAEQFDVARGTIREALKRLELVPDRIVTSTAKRASETAARVSKASGFTGTLERTRDLYLSGADSYVRTLIERAEASDERVMLVGHNPDCENLVHRLSGAREPITTANLACIDFDVDAWEDVATTPGTLRFVLRPRELE